MEDGTMVMMVQVVLMETQVISGINVGNPADAGTIPQIGVVRNYRLLDGTNECINWFNGNN